MNNHDDINHTLKLENLRAKLESLETRRNALLREIRSPLTSQDRREEAFANRGRLTAQWIWAVAELKITARG
jgi:hypothetical protein